MVPPRGIVCDDGEAANVNAGSDTITIVWQLAVCRLASVAVHVTDVVPTQEGVSYTVVVKASDKVKKGAIEGTVKLYTTDKEKSVIELPLKGEVL